MFASVSLQTGSASITAPTSITTWYNSIGVPFDTDHSITVGHSVSAQPESCTWNFINGFSTVTMASMSGTMTWAVNDTNPQTVTQTLAKVSHSMPLGLNVAFAKVKYNGSVPTPTSQYTKYENL